MSSYSSWLMSEFLYSMHILLNLSFSTETLSLIVSNFFSFISNVSNSFIKSLSSFFELSKSSVSLLISLESLLHSDCVLLIDSMISSAYVSILDLRSFHQIHLSFNTLKILVDIILRILVHYFNLSNILLGLFYN